MDASFGYSSIAHSQPSHYAQPYFTQVTQQSFNILQCPRVFPNFDSREQKDFLLADEQGTATNTIVLHHDLTKEFLQTSNGMPLQQDNHDVVDTKTLFVEDVDTKPFMAGQIQVVPQPGGQLTATHLQGPVIQVQLVSQQHLDTDVLLDGQEDDEMVVSPKMKKEKRKGDPKAGEYLLTKEDIDKLNSRKLSAAPTVSKMKKFTCDSCGRSLMTKQALDIHMRSHTGEKPYTCDDCGKTFVQQATLNRHRKGVHMPKSQECFECGKLFGYRDYLVKHMRTHTGERPYQCSKCEKTFRDKTSLNQHSRSHKD